MSNKLHENIYDNLQPNYNSYIHNDTSDNSEIVNNDPDNDLDVVLRDRKDSIEIKTNRQRHKKHKSWNQKKLNEINSKYFEDNLNDTNCDEASDKENARLSQKSKRSKSVGFVLKTEKSSDDSFETADDGSDDEHKFEVARNHITAQVQNHYYPPSLTTTKPASESFEQHDLVKYPVVKCTSIEKAYIPISSDEPESYSETETDDEFLPKKQIGWNPPSPPALPQLPPEINVSTESTQSKVDMSTFMQKKSLATGMMDLALLSANTNQLRYIMDSRNSHPYFTTSIMLISFSLVLQILVGLSLIWNTQYNIRKKSELRVADRLNNVSVVGVFLISIINVFISTFGGTTTGGGSGDIIKLDNDFENTINATSVENI